MITGSGYLQEFHMLWFEQHKGSKDVRIVNRSDELSTISIAGPRSRELLELVTSVAVDKASMPFMSVHSIDVGLAPCLVARLSFTGELGYEIYVPTVHAGSRARVLRLSGESVLGTWRMKWLARTRLITPRASPRALMVFDT